MKYFDYAATTPIDERVFKAYQKIGEECFFNSDCNKYAKKLETETRSLILDTLKFDKNQYELVFTSGGTEANNLAILSFAKSLEEKSHFITTCFEHASVDSCFKELERQGHEVTYITVDKTGHINQNDIYNNIKKNTKFISIMSVNNELGSRQPIEEVFKNIKTVRTDIIKMTDYVQGLGKIKVDFTHADLITISSHKIYGPKGVGALIKTKTTKIKPLICGGTNEFNMRAGLHSLPAQVAFGQAVVKIINDFEYDVAKINQSRDHFINLINKSDILNVNCPTEANVVSIRVASQKENTDILELMENQGFYLSARCADSAGIKLFSRSLLGSGLSEHEIDRTMRISFSHLTTKNDVNELVATLENVVRNN